MKAILFTIELILLIVAIVIHDIYILLEAWLAMGITLWPESSNNKVK